MTVNIQNVKTCLTVSQCLLLLPQPLADHSSPIYIRSENQFLVTVDNSLLLHEHTEINLIIVKLNIVHTNKHVDKTIKLNLIHDNYKRI